MTENAFEFWGKDDATGIEVFQRQVDGRSTGNNEGSLEQEVQLRRSSGDVLFTTSLWVHYEYWGGVDVRFSEDGTTATVAGSDDATTEIWSLETGKLIEVQKRPSKFD